MDPAGLKLFAHVAAGHEGVLSDHDDTVVVKPCTQTEIDFYQSANASYPQLAYFMPAFLGTLELNDQAKAGALATDSAGPVGTVESPGLNGSDHSKATFSHRSTGSQSLLDPSAIYGALQTYPQPSSRPSSRPPTPEPLRLRGKPIATDTCVVLSAVTSGFKRPNILDLKLGSRLWGDDAPPVKRARLDRVSRETTSSSLGFRIAGMRLWKGQGPHPAVNGDVSFSLSTATADIESESSTQEPQRQEQVAYEEDTNYLVYNKFYGRAVQADKVVDAFKEYFVVPSAGVDHRHALELIPNFRREIKEIHDVLENIESRMYSSSLLLVYEGDPDAYEEALEYQKQRREAEANAGHVNDGTHEDMDDLLNYASNGSFPEGIGDSGEEDEEERRTYALKLIDFAHASWTPGQGPDGNVMQGMQSAMKVLEDLEKQLTGLR